MSRLLRAEVLKLRTTRTFLALTLSALALSLIVVVLTAVLSDSWSEGDVRMLFTGDFTGLFIALLGIMGMAGEWRHRTITSTILAAPDRARLLTAKTIAHLVVGALVSLLVTVFIMAVGTIILESRDLPTADTSTLADVLWRNVLVAALLGSLGVCIGALVRQQAVAIVGLLFLGFVVEPVLLGLAPDVARYGPVVGAPNGIVDIQLGDEDPLAPGTAVIVILGWLGLLHAAGAVLLRRRDLT